MPGARPPDPIRAKRSTVAARSVQRQAARTGAFDSGAAKIDGAGQAEARRVPPVVFGIRVAGLEFLGFTTPEASFWY